MSVLVRLLLITRRLTRSQLMVLFIFSAVIAGIVIALVYFLNPDSVNITTTAGTLSIKRGKYQDALILLSPGGGIDEPWIDSGITVKKGDKIHITATGRIHCSIKKLVYSAETDKKLEIPWVDPNGMEVHQDQSNTYTDRFKLLPDANGAHYGLGMLLATIRSLTGEQKGQIDKIQPVGTDNIFEASIDGKLLLTVNDIWLDQSKKDAYLRPKEDNKDYYLRKAKQENDKLAKPEDSSKWSKKIIDRKINEQYQKRENQWNEIVTKKNWDVWYSDNVGAFSVSVSIESK